MRADPRARRATPPPRRDARHAAMNERMPLLSFVDIVEVLSQNKETKR